MTSQPAAELPRLLPGPPRDVLRAAPARRARTTLAAVALVVAGLFLIPIVALLANLGRESHGTWEHLAQTVLPDYILNTLWLVLGVGVLVAAIGTATAWLVTLCRFPGRRLFEWALILPLAVPAYVMAYAYTDLLQFAGPLQSLLRELTGWGARDYWFPEVHSLGGAIAMLALVLYPYVYLLARAAFLEQSVCALEVSWTLGCGPWASFWRVALPCARPALVAGTALALMETLADYGTVAFFGISTFTTGVVRAWISFGDRVAAGQLASLLLVFVFIVLGLEQWSRTRARFHHTSSRYQRLPSFRLRGWRAAGAVVLCLLPILLGFLVPCGSLLAMAMGAERAQLDTRYLNLALNSLTLAGTTALAAVVLAAALAYGLRLNPSPLQRIATRLAAMGYAVPGAVIAVGVLIPFSLFDNALDRLMRESFGLATGLLLTGSATALVFAYLVRFLAVSLNAVEASLGKIPPSLDDAARNLGRSPLGTLLQVHAPLMWGSLLTAALVVFVDVMKELPATLIMRPFNFDTLAVQAYNYASDERLAQAATPSLTIVAVGILPVILLSRAIARSRPGEGRRREAAPVAAL